MKHCSAETKRRFRVGIPALLVSVWALVMITVMTQDWLAPYPRPARFNHDVDGPILAIELAHGKADVERVVPPENYEAMPDECRQANLGDQGCEPALRRLSRRAIFVNTVLDLVFIPLYVWYLVIFARTLAGNSALAKAASVSAILAGAADLVEDALIFSALQTGTTSVYIPSLVKWTTLGIAVILMGRILVGKHPVLYSIATDRLLGVVHLCAGALLIFGVAAGEWIGYSWIQHGAAVFAVTFLITGWYVPIYCARRLLPRRVVRIIENFCERRHRGEPVGQAVQPQS